MADELISRQVAKDKLAVMNLYFRVYGVDKYLDDLIDEIPAVDAVEVVRCKDCEYYEGGECVNPYLFMSDGAHYYPELNDFCSNGERREENAVD